MKKSESVKYNLKEAAGLLEIDRWDLVKRVCQREIEPLIDGAEVYILEKTLCDYMGGGEETVEGKVEVKKTGKGRKGDLEEAINGGVGLPEEDESFWRERVENILGERTEGYLGKYGEEKVRGMVNYFASRIEEGDLKALFDADQGEQLMKLKGGRMNDYVSNLLVLVDMIKGHYGKDIPEKYRIGESAVRFLPYGINNLVSELDKLVVPKNNGTEDDVGEICKKIGCEKETVEGLIEEGFNVIYLDSMLRKGLGLESKKKAVAKSRIDQSLWDKNVKRNLRAMGVAFDKEQFDETLDKLGGLLEFTNQGKISLRSSWSSTDKKHLKEYLANILTPNGK